MASRTCRGVERSDAWLRSFGIAFGSTPHRAEGDELRAMHHARRAEAEVAAHGLEAWDGVLCRRLARATL